MAVRVVASVAVVVLASLAPPAFAAQGDKPKHQDPVELWKTFPIGTPTVQSVPQPNEAQNPKPLAPVSPSSSVTPAQPSPDSSVPVGWVAGGVSGALLIGLLGVVMRTRRKRTQDGWAASCVESERERSAGLLSIADGWPEDVERAFKRMMQGVSDGSPPPTGPPSNTERQTLTAAVASVGVRWNTVGNQSPPSRRDPMSDGSQEEMVVLESSAQVGEDGDTSGVDQPAVAQARVDIGEHINEIIRTAEEASRRVRVDAESEAADIRAQANARLAEVEQETHRLRGEAEAYAAETRQVVDSYASQKRRQIDAEASRIESEAESQARAVREAAEEMAKQIEAEARQTQTVLREETRAIEARLDRLIRGLRETGSQVEALLNRGKSSDSLVDALGVDRQRVPAREQES
jgi:hypothetical protein